jgi:DHA1 family tetracycline resistance protein-like MFS transporter
MAEKQASVEPPTKSRRPSRLFEARQRLQTAEAQQLISLMCVGLTVFIDFMGLSLQNPLIPFYVEEFEDAREMGLGFASSVLMTAYAISQFIATPFFGFGSDRFGRRPFLLLSIAGSCVGFLAQGFATSFTALCIMRFITGLFSGSRPVALAYVSDSYPPEKQAKCMAMLAVCVSMSFFLAPTLGGSLGLVHLSLPCFFQSGLSGIVLWFAFRYIKEPKRFGDAPSGKQPGVESAGRVKILLCLNAIAGFTVMAKATAWQTLMPVVGVSRLGLNQNDVGIIMGSAGLMVLVAQLGVFTPMSRRVRIHAISMFGCIFLSAPGLLYFLDPRVWILVVASVCQSCGMALTIPTITLTVSLLSPPAHRGGNIALTVLCQSLSRVVAPLLFGGAYDNDARMPFAMVLGCAAITLVLMFVLALNVKKIAPPKPKTNADDTPVPHKVAEESIPGQDLERLQAEKADMLQHLFSVHEDLEQHVQILRSRLEELKAGAEQSDLPYPSVTLEQKHELGVWFADMLLKHNYKRFPTNLDAIKCVVRNSFPKIRASAEPRTEDLVYLLESHLMLEQRWEKFVTDRREPWTTHVDEWAAMNLGAGFDLPSEPSEHSETRNQTNV